MKQILLSVCIGLVVPCMSHWPHGAPNEDSLFSFEGCKLYDDPYTCIRLSLECYNEYHYYTANRECIIIGYNVACCKKPTRNDNGVLVGKNRETVDKPRMDFKCGESHNKVRFKRSVNSKDAREHLVDYLVQIYRKGNGDENYEFVCNGVIVSKHWILTAGHCVRIDRKYRVQLGKTRISTGALDEERTFDLEKIVHHPNYSYVEMTNDLALLRVRQYINFERLNTMPICLAWGEEANTDHAGSILTMASWGGMEFRGVDRAEILQENSYLILDDYSCGSFLKQQYPNSSTKDMICVSHPMGSGGTCTGDSGAPLIYQSTKSDKGTLLGIVSRGNGCNMKASVFVSLRYSGYLEWIRKEAFFSELF